MRDKVIYIFIAYIILVSNSIYAQDSTLVFTYNYTFNPSYDKGFVSVQKSTLLISDTSYEIRQEMPVVQNTSIPQVPKMFDKDILMGYINDSIVYRYYNRNNNYDALVIVDSLPAIQWHIEDSSKIIAGYSCKKAFANYRGSEVVAFFTQDIPVSLGPYKFKGLPGLILELYSLDQDHHWVLTAVDSSTDDHVYENFDFDNIISLEAFVKENEKIDKNHRDMIHARLKAVVEKNGGTYHGATNKYYRTGIEKTYEWEIKK